MRFLAAARVERDVLPSFNKHVDEHFLFICIRTLQLLHRKIGALGSEYPLTPWGVQGSPRVTGAEGVLDIQTLYLLGHFRQLFLHSKS